MSTSSARRPGALAFAAAGVLFVLYPATRPWHDEATAAGATASMTSPWWVASHLFAMIGFVLLGFGLLALREALRGTAAARPALGALLAGWAGAGLALPYYGAEDFGLQGIAGQPGVDVLAAAQAIRYHPAAITAFGAGLILLAVAGVLAAVAVWRSGVLPRGAGLGLALGLALFLPQFYTPAAVRLSHGVLLGAGAGWLALALWRAAGTAAPAPAPGTAAAAAA